MKITLILLTGILLFGLTESLPVGVYFQLSDFINDLLKGSNEIQTTTEPTTIEVTSNEPSTVKPTEPTLRPKLLGRPNSLITMTFSGWVPKTMATKATTTTTTEISTTRSMICKWDFGIKCGLYHTNTIG